MDDIKIKQIENDGSPQKIDEEMGGQVIDVWPVTQCSSHANH
jgi:hypothetical protein